jgi:phosphonate transport system substrate-binding protein
MQRRFLFKITTIATGLLTAAAVTACGQSAASPTGGGGAAAAKGDSDPATLTMGHIPSEDSTDLDARFQLVAKLLEKATGKQVKVTTATSYAAVIEAQRAGKVQIADYGPFSYKVAHDSGAGAELIGYLASTKDDPGTYHSTAIVPTSSKITSVAQFTGKKVCFVDPTSTSGYLFPSEVLLKNKINPKTGVKPVFAGGHDASVLAIANGQCDAGFAEDSMVPQLLGTGQLKKGAVKTIWTSVGIPPSPITVSSNLSPGLKKKIENVFLKELNVDWLKANGYCAKTAKDCKLPSSDAWGYKPIDDKTYDAIREVCRVTKSDSCNA